MKEVINFIKSNKLTTAIIIGIIIIIALVTLYVGYQNGYSDGFSYAKNKYNVETQEAIPSDTAKEVDASNDKTTENPETSSEIQADTTPDEITTEPLEEEIIPQAEIEETTSVTTDAETVYYTDSGKKYHIKSCSTLSKSKSLNSCTVPEAEEKGLQACKKCIDK